MTTDSRERAASESPAHPGGRLRDAELSDVGSSQGAGGGAASEKLAPPPLRVLSLGAGVQSTTMALMSQNAALPRIDCAIFADTGEEPRAVYEHLERIKGWVSFPIHVVRAWDGRGKPSIKGPLGDEIIASTRGEGKAGLHSRPPFFTRNPDGSGGMLRRHCTGDYKIDPIQQEIRALLGLRRGQRWPTEPVVEQWIGISTDEATRMKPSMLPAIRSRWPLIEKGMSRRDCLAWLERHGYLPLPPKSACTFCPFHSDSEWRWLRDEDPESWARACQIDDAIRHGLTSKGLTGALFLHSQRVPLRQVDLSTARERGQLNLFENECEGMCGV